MASSCHHPDPVKNEKEAAPPSFENALGRLESIVDAMESGDVPLAELLAKFEEGNSLLKICEAHLEKAELKIEQLKKTRSGEALEAFQMDPET